MCAETSLDASTQNDKSRVEKESTSVITGSVTFQLRMHQKPFISWAVSSPAAELAVFLDSLSASSWIWGRAPWDINVSSVKVAS